MITPFIPKFVFSLAAEATYFLRTLFSGVSGPWSDGQTLDTSGEGVTDGSRTVVDTGAGSLTVVSNKQAVTGSGTNNETGIIEASVTREKGHTYQHKFTVPSGGNSYIGFHTSAVLSTQISGVRISGTNVYAVIGATQILVGTVTVGQEYTITEVLDTAGFALYIEGGTEYTTGTMLYIDDTDSTATVHPQNQTVAAVQTLTDDYLIPETLYPELVTPIIENAGPSANINFSSNPLANQPNITICEMSVASGQSSALYQRWASTPPDWVNHLRVNHDQLGDVNIVDYIGGTKYVRATTTKVLTQDVYYNRMVIDTGDKITYICDGIILSYTTSIYNDQLGVAYYSAGLTREMKLYLITPVNFPDI